MVQEFAGAVTDGVAAGCGVGATGAGTAFTGFGMSSAVRR
jgi:hypothetical protein